MSSNLLEEAIVDARALKEAALKNAQQAILEKYAPEVKKAINMLIEQEMTPEDSEEDPLAGLGGDTLPDLGMGGDSPALGGDTELPQMDPGVEPEPTSAAVNKLPLAATEGEKLCACPDEDEEVEINFDELEKQMGMDQSSDNPANAKDEQQPLALQEEIDIDESIFENLLFEEEDDSEEKETLPEVKDDSEDVKEEQKKLEESRRASRQVSKDKETGKQLSSLMKMVKDIETKNNALNEENKKFKKIIYDLTGRMEEVNLSNAKLLYTNQALRSDSLNERQKEKLVEAISKADSVDDAKLIFETLKHTVGSGDKPKEPKSLNETIVNKNGLSFKRRSPEQSSNPAYDRMRKMAGITKK